MMPIGKIFKTFTYKVNTSNLNVEIRLLIMETRYNRRMELARREALEMAGVCRGFQMKGGPSSAKRPVVTAKHKGAGAGRPAAADCWPMPVGPHGLRTTGP